MSNDRGERALVDAAIAGDIAALEQLLSVHFDALERHVAPRIPADAQRQIGAEDIVQEVFSNAFRDISRFQCRDDASFLGWLKTIADHRLADAIKHLGRKKRGGGHHQLTASQVAKTSAVATLIDIVGHDSHLPDDSAIRREAEKAMHVALAGLPEDQRLALLSHYIQGDDVAQIASRMGRTVGAVRGLIDRGKKNLAAAMGRSSRWFSSR
jgi:RNA polymerase sigma-70 factor (ECF subfamily)